MAVLGDGQYDSRGFSARFCRYVLMDHTTRMIIGSTIVEKSQTESKFKHIKFLILLRHISTDGTSGMFTDPRGYFELQ